MTRVTKDAAAHDRRELAVGLAGAYMGAAQSATHVHVHIMDDAGYANIYLDREEAARLFETLSEFIGTIDAQS